MKAIDERFPKIINGNTQFVIPVFQRDYSWTEPQCEQLWKDIMQASANGSDSGHFLGSIVYAEAGDNAAGFTRWLLIDGQQRLTTLVLILTALRDHIRESGWVGGENDPTPERIDAYFLKNTLEAGSRSKKLVLRRHDNAALADLIDGKRPADEVAERILDNYDLFREKLEGVDPARVYQGVARLVIVDVKLHATDDPQLVFESLNSTGVDLTQADLIRNFILMRLDEAEQTRLYESYWSRIESLFRGSERTFDAFARDFLALKTRATKQEKASEIYSAFRGFFRGWVEEKGSLEEALGEMLRFARYYAAFTSGEGAPGTLREPLARLRRLVDVPAVLVMRLYAAFDEAGALSDSEFAESLRLLESFVLRRAICGLNTRNYWQVFANIAYRISDERPLEDLKVALARQHDSYRFPTDEEFRSALESRDLYGLRVSRHLLEGLENYGSNEPSDTGSYSIEHIMPQNENLPAAWREMLGDDWHRVQEEWLHRLGNLTLTGYNSTYSDSPFEEKKSIPGGFAESSVRLNRFVRERDAWTEDAIRERTQKLAERSVGLWPKLQVSKEAIDAAKLRDLQELAARRDVTKVRMSATASDLFGALRDRIHALDGNVLEVAETRSVSYHSPQFFMEVLPRKRQLKLLLPLEFHEIEDPHGLAEDTTKRNFFFYAQHEGGVALTVGSPEDIDHALPIVQQSMSLATV
jgi:predicted transport protein